MIIQFNTHDKIAGDEKHKNWVTALISEELKRFSDQITRVEVHLSDEDGPKESKGDKHCIIEARLEGLKPIAVTNNADTTEEAIEGAIVKLKTSLDTIIGRMRNH